MSYGSFSRCKLYSSTFVHCIHWDLLRPCLSVSFGWVTLKLTASKGCFLAVKVGLLTIVHSPKISNMGTWKKNLWKRRNNIYKPLNSRFHANFLGCKFLKFTTCSSHFSLSHFHPQGFPNIWSHLCYKKIQLGYARIVLSSLLWIR